MIFGPFEILLCLLPTMIVMGTIAVRLYQQNQMIERRQRHRGMMECPNCRQLINREAYICRFCSHELADGPKKDLIDQ